MYKLFKSLFTLSVDDIISDFESKIRALEKLSERKAEEAVDLKVAMLEADRESVRAEQIADRLLALVA